MINHNNELFTLCKNAIESVCNSASQSFQAVPTNLPHFYLKSLGNPISEKCIDSDMTENAVEAKFQLHVYTNGATKLSAAMKIIELADAIMLEKGFIRIYGPEDPENLQDASICQLVTRYKGIIYKDGSVYYK